MTADCVIEHIKTLYTPVGNQPLKGVSMGDVKAIDDAFVAIKNGMFIAIGTKDAAPYKSPETDVFDASGKIAFPGLIDSHTHLVYGGSREDEFSQKITGKPYMDILEEGGGILRTVRQTRDTGFDALYETASQSLERMLEFGVTALEAKSGYGLNLETEIKQLEVIKALNDQYPVDIHATYLGAHALPEESKRDRRGFIDHIIDDMKIIKKKNLAESVDVFCEKGVFDVTETRRIIEAAKQLGFVPRIHADEMTSIGGAGLGVELEAASVDHLMAISDDDIRLLAKSNTVANLLPATSFYLNKAYADARKLIQSGAAVSIASDYNPGSTPSENFQFTMQLAGIKLKMTPEEILSAATINPAYHLGIADTHGSIEEGKQADLCLSDAKNLAYMIQRYAINLVTDVFVKGKHVVHERHMKEETK